MSIACDIPGDPSVPTRLGYSVGNLGKSVVLTVFDTFLLYYLVRIAGIPAVAAGALLTAVMLWDGLADLIVAWLADRHGRAGALGRLILLGAPLCGASFWAIFLVPPGGIDRMAIAVLLCRTGYTLCDIGHNTLLVRIATSARTASSVSGMRLIFSACGAGLVGLATSAILTADAPDRGGAIARGALVGGALYIVTLVTAVFATRRLPVAPARTRPGDAAAIVRGLWRNRMYRDVLALIALQAGLVPLFGRALPFVGEAVHGGAGWAGTALATIAAAQALSLPGWMTVSRWRSPRAILLLGHAMMLGALALLAAEAGGVIGLAGLALIGVAQAGMNMAIWAMLALSVRRDAGARGMNEALPVGVFLAVLKGSAGIGNALLAGSVALGGRWSSVNVRHEADLTTAAAIVLPMLGCVAALLLAARQARA